MSVENQNKALAFNAPLKVLVAGGLAVTMSACASNTAPTPYEEEATVAGVPNAVVRTSPVNMCTDTKGLLRFDETGGSGDCSGELYRPPAKVCSDADKGNDFDFVGFFNRTIGRVGITDQQQARYWAQRQCQESGATAQLQETWSAGANNVSMAVDESGVVVQQKPQCYEAGNWFNERQLRLLHPGAVVLSVGDQRDGKRCANLAGGPR